VAINLVGPGEATSFDKGLSLPPGNRCQWRSA